MGTATPSTSSAGKRPSVIVTAPVDDRTIHAVSAIADLHLLNHGRQGGNLRDGEAADSLSTANVVICELDRIDENDLELAPNLELIIVCRSNPVNVDLEACARHGITVATTPGRNADSTADVTLGLMIEALRQLPAAEQWLEDEPWNDEDVFLPYRRFRGRTLSCCTVGVVGYGHVGQGVVRRLLGFGAQVLVWSRSDHSQELPEGVRQVDLETLLRSSDIITLHLPANAQTNGFIGAEEIALMRRHALLVNTARASLLDEDATLEALRNHRIAGGAFDVFWQEPLPAHHPLRALDNVVMSPHIGGASDDVITVQTRMAVEALHRWLNNQH